MRIPLMHIKLFVTTILVASCAVATKADDIYWDYNNDTPLSSGLERNAKKEIVTNNHSSATLRMETFSFNNPDSNNFLFNIRLRDGFDLTKKDRFLSRKNPTSPFGVVWDFVDSLNYCAMTLQRQSKNHYDEIAREDIFNIVIYKINNGVKTTIKKCDVKNNIAFESNEYNSLTLKAADGKLTISAGNKKLKTIFACDYNIQNTFTAGVIISPNSRLSIKRIHFKDFPDNRRTNMTTYTQEDIAQIIALNEPDKYVGYWRYLDRITDDKLFVLGGKYTLVIVPSGNGNYDILYNSGATKYPTYWKPLMKKGMLERTPFFDHYDLHWYSADKLHFFDESYVSVSDGIMTMYFPVQKSSVRFYRITAPSRKP